MPPVGTGGGYMFSDRPSVPLSVRPCVCDSRGSFVSAISPVSVGGFSPFVTGASRDRDELIRFWGQKVKVQGHTIAAEAHSTQRYRRVQLFLVSICCALSNHTLVLEGHSNVKTARKATGNHLGYFPKTWFPSMAASKMACNCGRCSPTSTAACRRSSTAASRMSCSSGCCSSSSTAACQMMGVIDLLLWTAEYQKKTLVLTSEVKIYHSLATDSVNRTSSSLQLSQIGLCYIQATFNATILVLFCLVFAGTITVWWNINKFIKSSLM